jgi:hypothetical protein
VRSEEIAELVAALPQGMDADEFIVKLVSWAVDIEREACAKLIEPLDESLADEIRARGKK